jgi:hypothetical protein
MKTKTMKKTFVLTVAIAATFLAGLLLMVLSTSGIALAAINCNDTGTVCSGGSGQGGSFDQGGFGGGGGGRTTAQCTQRGCPETVTGGFGGGGIGGVGIGSSSGVGGGSGRGGQESCLVGVHSSCTTINGGGSFP